MSLASSKPAAYRPDVDGLRAIAILAVLVFHAFPGALAGGFVGVDIFFVISGFLITGILLRDKKISIRTFYIRRIKRIFPALALVLLVVLGLGWLLLLPSELRDLGRYTLAGSLFSSNIVLWRDSGYFDRLAAAKPLLHLWSLGVEEQYYFVWPLFVAVLRNRRIFPYAMAVAAVLSFVLCLWGTYHARSAAFYLPATRFWELAVGGALALAVWRGHTGHPRTNAVAAWAGLVLLAASVTIISEQRPFPGIWATIPVAGTALLIGSGAATLPARILSHRWFVALGLISYPLYLWHWPLLTFARILLGRAPGPWTNGTLCAISVVVATVTYKVIELRVRRARGWWTRPSVLLGAVAVAGLLGGIAFGAQGFPSRVPSATQANKRDVLDLGCPQSLQGGALDSLNICRKTGAEPTSIALIGDSHAKSLFDGLAEIDGGWLLLGNTSCAPLLGVHLESEVKSCKDKTDRMLRFLQSDEAKSIATVLITFYFGYALDTAFSADHLENHFGPDHITIDGHKDRASKEPLFERGLDAFIAAVIATGKHVVLLTDVPEFPVLPERCATRPAAGAWLRGRLSDPKACVIPRATVEARQRSYIAMVHRLAAKQPALRISPTLDAICEPSLCRMQGPNGEILYVDSHHLSIYGARRVAEALRSSLIDP
jgi:peptidoglycan/LPS O-acetylase OafA/YrhL